MAKTIVIWAIDPFESKALPHPSEIQMWLKWAKDLGAEIQPVYVYNRRPQKEARGVASDTLAGKLRVCEELKTYLVTSGCSSHLTPEILTSYDSPTGGIVQMLLQYAKKIKAHAILVSSRGRKGFDRFVFGSIAENLLLLSPIPVIFLTHLHEATTLSTRNAILFPTDLSDHSKKVFGHLLSSAKKFHAEIAIYHGNCLQTATAETETMSLPDDYLTENEDRTKRELEKLVVAATEAGVKASFRIEHIGMSLYLAPAIIEAAQKNSVRFIAMATSSGRFGSIFFGSVAREVMRANLYSVMAYGPNIFDVENESSQSQGFTKIK